VSGSPEHGELERRIVTVLFCDLAGFTSLSERLDAEDVAIVQSAYFEAVRYAVTRHGGTLEKFIGDAVVAVFGVPAAGEDDAERAVCSALAITGAIEQLAARVGLEDGALQVRVGVNTGEAVVHPVPAAGEAMVTGDVVNTAARLQSAAPAGGVLVGPETALAVAHTVELAAVVELSLKGKSDPVRAAQALAVLSEPARERAMGALKAPTIGRTSELASVTAELESCADGAARRLTVIAPPGTGKSRLLEEVSHLAAARGAAVRRARVRPDVLSAFRPIVDLVSHALTAAGIGSGDDLASVLTRELGAERAEVVASELRELLEGSEDVEGDEATEARRSAGPWATASRCGSSRTFTGRDATSARSSRRRTRRIAVVDSSSVLRDHRYSRTTRRGSRAARLSPSSPFLPCRPRSSSVPWSVRRSQRSSSSDS